MRKFSPINLIMGIIGGVFFVIGMVFLLVIAVLLKNDISEKKDGVPTEAEITEIDYYYLDNGDRNWKVQISYEFEGEQYEKYIKHYSDGMYEGQRLTIYVNPQKPIYTYEPGETAVLLLVFGILGGVFGLIGISFLVVVFFVGKKKQDLLKNGNKVYAEVTGGDYCYNYNVNGRHPFRLECQYKDPITGAIYLYSSAATWVDPTYYIGQTVTVYVDKKNPRRYWVDVESLEKKVEIYDYR